MCKCTPRTRSAPPARVGVNFRTVFAGQVRFGGIFRRSWSATTIKKGRQLFCQEKVHPTQNPGYAYGSRPTAFEMYLKENYHYVIFLRKSRPNLYNTES